MKNYLVINGKTAYRITKESDSEARDWTINFCDHSKFVGYYEVDEVITINTLEK